MSVDNPVFLIDKVVRGKIFNSAYYKEKCFGLNAETLIDRAVELKAIGSTFGGIRRPTPFLCLVFKLLQIAPEIEIVEKYVKQDDFKYLRAVGAMYCRLVGKPVQVYNLLEPLYTDFSKLRRQRPDCSFEIVHMDEFIEELLHNEVVMEVQLPHIPKRMILEETEGLAPRVSSIEHELDWEEDEEEPDRTEERKRVRPLKKAGLADSGQNPHKEPVPESIEYWNLIRQQLGLPPLKPNA
mmetsp:Transcript_9451/g.18193  ORF Transcript_9451/g.18193 Transcript_9451/m.18193 type:complete len:239 (-) Transcript_9451:63-779(-)